MSVGEEYETESWVDWFIYEHGYDFMCEVDQSYIEDGFNLYGLRSIIPRFKDCLNAIQDCAGRDEWSGALFKHTKDLYGLIHARFILTVKGMSIMAKKYERGDFGNCPRVYCSAERVLPVGLRNDLGGNLVKVFCPRCKDVYHPPRSLKLDGAYFGTSFPHLLLLSRPSLSPPPISKEKYVPKVFGFRIYDGRFGTPEEIDERNRERDAVAKATKALADADEATGGGEGSGAAVARRTSRT